MGFFKKRINYKNSADTSLVLAAIGGDRDAFGEIVGRYQSLLCSLAYSSVGDLKHSEDIAQETFVEAWRKLDTLSDPAKLKAWLCGILRFKISRYRRKETRHAPQPTDELHEQVAEHSRVDDAVIQEQEQALLWQALQQLPETYREPLVLFYREQQSIEHVAAELELSEDAVKQRLSRGRKALQKAMVTFVQDTLAKSKPGASFTMAVLLAISTISAPKAKAALFSAGVAHTGSAIKWGSFLTIMASFSGVIGSFFSVRASLAQSRTERERRATLKIVALYFLVAAVFVAGMFLLKYVALASTAYQSLYALGSQLMVFGFIAAYLALLTHMLISQPRLRTQERQRQPEAFLAEYDQVNSKRREYKSRLSLFGIPIIHVKLGLPELHEKPAFGWIAGGDRAYGLVFAWGGLAVAPISVGIVSLGVITVGALGFGVLAAGTVAVGVIGFGASTIAYKAYGSLSALGWESAWSGSFAIAKDAAIGPIPFATLTNSEPAADIVQLTALSQNHLWVLGAMSILVIAPAAWHSNMVRKRIAEQHNNTE
ncbi:sigma-70 family RNA polymerase sigma factor [uncultured Gilvimarinus sp.]|uniref:RNA polymerase sigma factor n=1 Tax=uncultured Gilvimarinus sp. TaxID=1689143 RepID=UPI0030DB3E04